MNFHSVEDLKRWFDTTIAKTCSNRPATGKILPMMDTNSQAFKLVSHYFLYCYISYNRVPLIIDKTTSEFRCAREKPWLSTIVDVSSLLLLNYIRSQKLGDIPKYLVCQTKPIFATPTAPMGSKTGVEGSILACPDFVPASKMQA